jgi:hypothetical protein
VVNAVAKDFRYFRLPKIACNKTHAIATIVRAKPTRKPTSPVIREITPLARAAPTAPNPMKNEDDTPKHTPSEA